ncbi:MAG TPA: pyridoxamine 5'-phosphate oxidase family protein [Actinocrinis sp.]|nr:pyridoxamine 5'-phosphate oxidase family protein [Actinocrinis sp.]
MELSRRECLMLLSTRPFGRIVYTASGLPAVVPVNFLVEPAEWDEDVLVCTVRADWLLASIDHAVVGLQADELDRGMAGGWWVTVVGRAEPVEDRAEAAALRADPRWPRIIDDGEAVVRLRAGLTSGRQFSAAGPAS